MKILIITKNITGGVGRYVCEISKGLKRKGHKVRILSREDDLKIYSFAKSIFPLRKMVKNIYNEWNFDIVYTQDWSTTLPLLFPYPIFKNKHFSCFHGNEVFLFSKIFQKITGYLMKEQLIVVGPSLKMRFPKAILIYEGVDIKNFVPIKKEIKYVGFVKKETETLKETHIKKIAYDLGLEALIANDIPYEKMNEWYNNLKIFISIPPPFAGFNLVWLEAMASGVPIIIGNNEGVGKILPITKVEDFGWKDYLSDDEKIEIVKKAIKNAKKIDYRKWIEENNFTWDFHVNMLLKIFRENFKK